MRSTISDQDLTDYALNELEANQRIYVESMLAVSEECRNDVYEIIDIAMLLEHGFERQNAKPPEGLTNEQREKLLTMSPRPRYVQRFAAVLAAAAAVALAWVAPQFWQGHHPARQVAQVSTQVSQYVVNAVTPDDGEDLVAQLSSWQQLAEDPVLKKWFNSEWFAAGESVSFGAGPAGAWDSMPRTGFDSMP
ncbi:MAG TPA: hypothetical protein VGO90_16685 [Chthoniobacteraceae bacterium]|jgi:hypothetical protein|nr:putative transrane anti-sigma factor [Chthoniobacter sp.]HEV7869327.1 hypothetical protein [Chthoniobacteraceae bacterium]